MIKRNSKEYKERVRRIIEFEKEHFSRGLAEKEKARIEEYKRDHSKARAEIERLRERAKEYPQFAESCLKEAEKIEELIK